MKNFSVGDVVVCVDDAPNPNDGSPALVSRGGLYTVADAWLDCDWGDACVELAGLVSGDSEGGPRPYRGWRSERFRLAYRPDPEVSRERHEEPVRRPAKAPVGANRANRRAAAE